MIDNASFVIEDYSNTEFERLTDRLDVVCPIDKPKLSLNLHNLRINYYPNINKLRIKNSLHCLFNKEFGIIKQPVNYNDFSFFDFQVVLEYLSKIIFERPLENFLVSTNFEVGLNIQLDNISPMDLLSRYMSYGRTVTNEFLTVPPAGLKGKPIEKMCFMNDYKLKLYDKSEQSKIPVKDIMRYEIVFTELRKIRQVLGYHKNFALNLSTLNDQHTWQTFFDSLLRMYDLIKKIPLLTEPFPPGDVAAIHGYCNKIMAYDIKNGMNVNTYNKRRAQMKKAYTRYDLSPNNYHQIVRQKLQSKFNRLINVHQFQGV